MANVYRFVKDVYNGIESYRVYTSSGMPSTGDMCQWDGTSRYATNALLASGAIFLGVAQETQPLVGLGTNTRPLTNDRIRIVSQGVHKFKTTNGETYSHNDPVYQGADAQTVSLVGATRIIGRVHLPDGSQVVGTGSNAVACRIFGSMTNNSTVPSSAAAAQ